MKRTIFLLALNFIALSGFAQSRFVRLQTNVGNITLRLYDETPKHRDAFLQSINKGLFNGAAFNRVIKGFVSQGGELDDVILEREAKQPDVPISRIDAELVPELIHKKGALGAGRNDNPEKSSYFTQIYLVAGKQHTAEQLEAIEKKKGLKFSALQKQMYTTIGGTPHLDGDYTVFGEVVDGMDVAGRINAVPTNKDDLPLSAITFTPKVLSKKEVAALLKLLP
ncbi:peptidylprolyl isomerase [Pedobacter sp.]|uniref:peptidylprolyl isomerase n=1 Tax=Pedobacter sp. TaxID=1411316 RepID=UPI003D7FC681